MQTDLVCHGYSRFHDPPHVAIEHIDNHRRNGHQQQVQRYSGVPRTCYNWNKEEKNDILGYFFWGFLLTQVPGGRLSEMYGTRIVIGVGLFCAALVTILIPVACHLHYYWVLFARFALGLALGVQWPAIPPMAAKWVSPSDTSKFMSHMVASALGAALTYPVCGYLIAFLGWPSVFYISGGITLLWTMAWFYLVYDSPEQHSRISREEKELLKDARIVNCAAKKSKTPWIKILNSAPVWAFVVGNVIFAFTTYLALYQVPGFISQVLHLNIKQNGWLSSLPHLGNCCKNSTTTFI
jgi:ACS family sodium-dependent inorganic phosphate cotransporter